MSDETKHRVSKEFENAHLQDLSIADISRKAHISEVTAAMYVRILEAEGKIVFTRNVGRAKMFKLKKEGSK